MSRVATFLRVALSFVVRNILGPRRIGGSVQATRVLSGCGGGAGDAAVVLEILWQGSMAGLDRRPQIVQLRFDLQIKKKIINQ